MKAESLLSLLSPGARSVVSGRAGVLRGAEPAPRGRVAGRALAAVALASLAACSQAPVYQRPEVATPAAFRESAWQAAQAQSPDVLDDWWTQFKDPVLSELQAQVVVNNQSLQAVVAQYRSAEAAVAISRAAQFPTVTGTLGASRSVSGTTNSTGTSGSSTPVNVFSLGANASWDTDLWGRLANATEAARTQVQASRSDLLAARLSLQVTLAQTYFSLRSVETQARSLARAVQAYEQSLQLTQNRYAAGVAGAADVAQAQTQLKSAQAQAIELRLQRAQLEHALAVLLGQAPANFRLAETARLPEAPPAPRLLPASLLQRRPDIAAAERRVAVANAQVGVTRAAFFPSLTLSASGGYRANQWSDLVSLPHRFWSLGPSMALALFDAGGREAATRQAWLAVDQASANYRQVVLTAFQEVEDNLVAADALAQEAQVQAEALAAARRALEIVSNQYKAGTVSYLNVISAQATALTAENTLTTVRNRQLLAVGQLLKNAAGRWDLPLSTEGAAPAAQKPPGA